MLQHQILPYLHSNIALQQQLPLILACQSRRLHHKMMAMSQLMLWAYPV